MKRGFFRERPETTRADWTGLGVLAVVLGVGLTVLLALYRPPRPAGTRPARGRSGCCSSAHVGCRRVRPRGAPPMRRCSASGATSPPPRSTRSDMRSRWTCSAATCRTPWSSGRPSAGRRRWPRWGPRGRPRAAGSALPGTPVRRGWDLGSLGDSLGSFAESSGSTFAASAASSGGSAGFSGGGFGGGGGGSW